MKIKIVLAVVFLACVAVSGCKSRSNGSQQAASIAAAAPSQAASSSTATADAPRSETFEGMIFLGFERSRFTPCGSKEPYWVNFDAEAQAALDKLAQGGSPGAHGPVTQGFIRGSATLSGPGEYGHMGQYPREIRFHSLSATSGACSVPKPEAK